MAGSGDNEITWKSGGADFSWDPGVLATLTGRVQNIHLPNTITAATTGASLLSSYPHTPPFLAPRYPP